MRVTLGEEEQEGPQTFTYYTLRNCRRGDILKNKYHLHQTFVKNLFLVNRQTYFEAARVTYSTGKFCFGSTGALTNFLSVVPAESLKVIRDVALEIDCTYTRATGTLCAGTPRSFLL